MGIRVVSLVPSVTETLLAWGIEPVACTRFCEQPDLLHVGGTKDPDVAAIVRLRPDLVVVDQEENRKQDAEALAEAGLAVHVLAIRALDDVAPAMVALAAAVGADPPLLDLPAGHEGEQLRAFVPIWRRPWMTLNADTYGSSLLGALGVTNVFAGHPERYPRIELADAIALAPDVVLAPSEPYPFKARHQAELAEVAPVVFVDGQDLFWWGARTPDALARFRGLCLTPGGGRRPLRGGRAG
ncbi:MAG: hypothetical protein QOG64_1065 [Acidimicrobiaceae bacterium]|nr:hypothetical protein [Acidimicrobiaceae bacterium]